MYGIIQEYINSCMSSHELRWLIYPLCGVLGTRRKQLGQHHQQYQQDGDQCTGTGNILISTYLVLMSLRVDSCPLEKIYIPRKKGTSQVKFNG